MLERSVHGEGGAENAVFAGVECFDLETVRTIATGDPCHCSFETVRTTVIPPNAGNDQNPLPLQGRVKIVFRAVRIRYPRSTGARNTRLSSTPDC